MIRYGSFLHDNLQPSSAIRHKLFWRFKMRCIITPQYHHLKEVLFPLISHGYALDNGAFIDFQKKTSFNDSLFLKACRKFGPMADFIVIPDVVQNADMTLYLANYWIPILQKMGFGHKLYFVWQNGMDAADIQPYIWDGINIFVGGSTEEKLKNMSWISDMCDKWGVYCHVGRVNTKKRVLLVRNTKATSFDGSGWSRFPYTFQFLADIEKQLSLFRDKRNTPALISKEERLSHFNIKSEVLLDWENKIKQVKTYGIGQPIKRRKYNILFSSL